jgi:Cdc6-like AAA superfamily ATPase
LLFHGSTKISLLLLQQDLTKPVPQPVPLTKHSSYLFTGRDEYLQELRDYFRSSIGGKRKSFLLYGLGGMGKTQICLKFIEENCGL